MAAQLNVQLLEIVAFRHAGVINLDAGLLCELLQLLLNSVSVGMLREQNRDLFAVKLLPVEISCLFRGNGNHERRSQHHS